MGAFGQPEHFEKVILSDQFVHHVCISDSVCSLLVVLALAAHRA